ncbi:MAG TPA: hypothetical protein ENJ95_24060 [Bacteroidetes bacterium]|nr:hypothetical protein [Bacteroidota bacterium]
MNWKHGKTITFLMVLIGHLFIFPRFFYPEPDPNGINCGMPILGITLAFWIIGGGGTVIIHLLYYFISKFVKYKLNKSELSESVDKEEKEN